MKYFFTLTLSILILVLVISSVQAGESTAVQVPKGFIELEVARGSSSMWVRASEIVGVLESTPKQGHFLTEIVLKEGANIAPTSESAAAVLKKISDTH